jgi:uncharacterized membrane protein YdbT with pleckstrin-like domain
MDEVTDRFRSSTWGWLRGTLAGWGTLLLCLIGIGFIIVLIKWIGNLTTTYEITSERLIIRRGIFMKSVDEIELYRIKDIRIDFSLINQWADIGTITIISSDETTRDGPLLILHVEAAQQRRENLRRLVDNARQKRSVREIDMVHEDLNDDLEQRF